MGEVEFKKESFFSIIVERFGYWDYLYDFYFIL